MGISLRPARDFAKRSFSTIRSFGVA